MINPFQSTKMKEIDPKYSISSKKSARVWELSEKFLARGWGLSEKNRVSPPGISPLPGGVGGCRKELKGPLTLFGTQALQLNRNIFQTFTRETLKFHRSTFGYYKNCQNSRVFELIKIKNRVTFPPRTSRVNG